MSIRAQALTSLRGWRGVTRPVLLAFLIVFTLGACTSDVTRDDSVQSPEPSVLSEDSSSAEPSSSAASSTPPASAASSKAAARLAAARLAAQRLAAQRLAAQRAARCAAWNSKYLYALRFDNPSSTPAAQQAWEGPWAGRMPSNCVPSSKVSQLLKTSRQLAARLDRDARALVKRQAAERARAAAADTGNDDSGGYDDSSTSGGGSSSGGGGGGGYTGPRCYDPGGVTYHPC